MTTETPTEHSIALVTGAGLGYAAASMLAFKGYRQVIVTGHSLARVKETAPQLAAETKTEVLAPLELDLDEPSSIEMALAASGGPATLRLGRIINNPQRIDNMNERILITGANIGLGKETARQLALRTETKKVILFCRNQARAEAAKQDLEETTRKKIFEIIIGDVTDAHSVRRAVEQIHEPIDAVILNAGGVVGKTAAKMTPSGMNQLAATNILGNVILVEELLKRDKLRKAVLAVSAEAVPGVKMLGVKPVSMRTSSVDEFAAVLDGSYFGKKFNALQAYAYVKYAETMWTLSMARQYHNLKFVVVSPGNTRGTQAPNYLPLPMRIMLKYVMMPIVFPLMGGMVHKLEVGAKRFVDGISEERYKSGVFYASKEGKLSGDMVDQSTFFTDLRNTSFQDNANEAIHHFIN